MKIQPIKSPEPTTTIAAVDLSVVLQTFPTFNSLAYASELDVRQRK